MAEKTKLNAYINTQLAEEFRKVAHVSYGQIGLCLSAAMLQFMESSTEEQTALVKRVFDAEEEGTMEALITEAKQKPQRPDTREAKKKK